MEELRSIEDANKAWDSGAATRPRPEIDVCEHADASAFELLSEGYSVTGFVCQFQRDLDEIDCPPSPVDKLVKIFAIRGLDHVADDKRSYEDFIDAPTQGFRSGGRNAATLKALAESAVARSDTSLCSDTIDGELVGTAVMAVIDVEGCNVASLCMDSCLEHARGKGVHKAFLSERMRVAKEIGCEMVIAASTLR